LPPKEVLDRAAVVRCGNDDGVPLASRALTCGTPSNGASRQSSEAVTAATASSIALSP
jgi:hypothetical protein